MDKSEIIKVLNDVGAILTDGHFVYTSGRHGNAYVNKDAVYPHTEQVRILCAEMAGPFVGKGIETVVGPTVGGVILAQWVAHELSVAQKAQVFACFAEEKVTPDGTKERYFGRGYEKYIGGKRVLVVEDILTTGGSVKQVVAAVRACGGEVIAVRALCNRGGVASADVGNAPLSALLDVALESWRPEECPMCKQNVPISTTVGKGGKR